MGTIRFLLAMAVVLSHAEGYEYQFVNSRNAVQMFYVISGFLISFVLVEKKSYASARDFYANRLLRLYPIYFVVAALALVFLLLTQRADFIAAYRDIPASGTALLVFSNAAILFQDMLNFLSVKDGALAYVPISKEATSGLYHGLIVPQAWTVSLELMFYLIAPFVLVRRWLLFAVLALSLGVKAMLFARGLGTTDPWSYRFFPAELSFFLIGALSHQFLMPLWRRIAQDRLKEISTAAMLLIAVLVVAYPYLPGGNMLKTAFLFALFIPLLPLLFVFQNTHRADAEIGELSYPVYISHVLMLWLLEYLMLRDVGINTHVLYFGGAALSILMAVFLNRQVAKPVEALRRRFKRDGQTSRSPHVAA